jgi:hypothetical protein
MLLGQTRRRVVLAASVAVWILAVGYGARSLLLYADTPGRPATPPARWPAGAPFRPDLDRATLLVFAHPQCPCSSATIGELASIMANSRDRVRATVFMYVPLGAGRGWTDTDLWRAAAIIPGVQVREDLDAAQARRFGARTSGQTLLYDVSQRLVFTGGITASRGHAGDNDGRDAITTLLQGGIPLASTTPVFGCALFGD